MIAVIHLLANYMCGLYGQMWRYASVKEAQSVLLAGAVSFVGVFALVMWAGHGTRPIPLSVIVVGSAAAVMASGAIRFQSRLFAVRRRSVDGHASRVLVIGAGDAGAQVIGDIQRHPEMGLRVVGLIDDDPRLRARELHGVGVVGGRAAIPELVRTFTADEVLLAIPSATSDLIRDVATRCEDAASRSECCLRCARSSEGESRLATFETCGSRTSWAGGRSRPTWQPCGNSCATSAS